MRVGTAPRTWPLQAIDLGAIMPAAGNADDGCNNDRVALEICASGEGCG